MRFRFLNSNKSSSNHISASSRIGRVPHEVFHHQINRLVAKGVHLRRSPCISSCTRIKKIGGDARIWGTWRLSRLQMKRALSLQMKLLFPWPIKSSFKTNKTSGCGHHLRGIRITSPFQTRFTLTLPITKSKPSPNTNLPSRPSIQMISHSATYQLISAPTCMNKRISTNFCLATSLCTVLNRDVILWVGEAWAKISRCRGTWRAQRMKDWSRSLSKILVDSRDTLRTTSKWTKRAKWW